MNTAIDVVYKKMQSQEKKLGDLRNYKKIKTIENYYSFGWIFGGKALIYALMGVILIPGIALLIGAMTGKMDLLYTVGSIVASILCLYILINIAIRELLSNRLENTKRQYTQLRNSLNKYNQYFRESIEDKMRIDAILSGTTDIRETIDFLIQYNNLGKTFMEGKYLKSLREYIKISIEFIAICLNDLRSDLQLRLTEQKKVLEQAKSSLSAHIHGTDELNQVSELQRQRLNKQIEQFEELQRVLVKV